MLSKEVLDTLSYDIIGAAMEVHKTIGPGLLECFYRKALAYELSQAGYRVEEELGLPVYYKDTFLGQTLRRDLFVEDEIIVEIKATLIQHPVFEQQLLTYLRLSGKRLGLLINFNQPTLIEGVKRVVNNL